MATTQPSPTTSPIGRDTPRIDGPRKVTGLAKYTSDFMFPGMLYAVPVEATIANGKLLTFVAEPSPCPLPEYREREKCARLIRHSRRRPGRGMLLEASEVSMSVTVSEFIVQRMLDWGITRMMNEMASEVNRAVSTN